MSIITIYPGITDVAAGDLLVISDISMDGNPTRTVSVSQLSAFIGGGGGGGLVDSINTTNGTFISLTPTVQTTGDVVVTADISATGTKDSTTFLRGDNTWAVPAGGNVSSVGLTETGDALTISNSPITSSGTMNIAGAGTASQVILGNLTLGTYTTGTLTDVNFTNNINAFSVAETVGAGTIDFVLSVTGGVAGQFLQQDGTWATPSGAGGSVTSIIAGTNITISPISGVGDVTVNATGAVTDLSGTLPITVSAATGSIDVGVNAATSTSLGVVQLPFATEQITAANSATTDASRTYGVQYFSGTNDLVVNVPWTGGGTVADVTYTTDIAAFTAAYQSVGTTEALTLNLNGGSVGQFLRQDGLWATPSGSGTVTSVTAGPGLVDTGTAVAPIIAVDYAITGLFTGAGAAVVPLGNDYILISDTSNAGNVVKALISDLPSGSGGVTSITPVATTGTGTAITTIGDITFTGAGGITTSVNASNVVTITGGAGSSLWTANGSDIYFTSGNVGIGFTAAPSASLEVSGRISQIGVNASTLIGFNAGLSQNNVTNNYSTAIGYEALTSNSSGLYNTALGFQSLKSNTTGNHNTSVGFQALKLNIGGDGNVAIGYDSLGKNTSGYQNSSIGWRALWSNVTGYQNVAMGYGAMTLNTSGSQNNAIGINALTFNTIGASNTAFGNLSLHDNTEGNFNVGVGVQALGKNTTGSNNVSLGYQAGFYITGGNPNFNIISDNSVFVGNNSQAAASGQTNQIVIGNDALGNGSNTVTIGDTSIQRTYLQGTVNTEGRMDAAFFKPDGYTFATLPSPPAVGSITYITDAGNIQWRGEAEATGTPGITTVAQVFYDGTIWRYV